MKKIIAWLLLAGMLGFGSYRIWDRNMQPPAPVASEQVQPAPVPPVVEAPVKAPAPTAKPAPHKPRVAPVQPPEPPKGGKAKSRPKAAPAPGSAPTRPHHVDQPFPRGADNGASTLPVSCATVRWYANNAPAIGEKLAATYNPTAAQIAAAKACLKKG